MTREQVDRFRGCISQLELVQANLRTLKHETSGPVAATFGYVHAEVKRLIEHLVYGAELPADERRKLEMEARARRQSCSTHSRART